MIASGVLSRLLFFLFLIAFISVYGFINYYIGKRIWKGIFSHIRFVKKKVYWIIFWIISFSYIIAKLLSKYPNKLVLFLELVGSLWLGMLFYIFIVLIFIDLVKLILKKLVKHRIEGLLSNSKLQISLSLVVTAFLIGLFTFGIWSANTVKVSSYNVTVDKGFKDLKIVMVSDIHIGNVVDDKRVRKLVDKINELNPDVVLMVGDIIDSELEPFIEYNIKDILKDINSVYGVYAVLGNHEGFNEELDRVVKEYEAAGLKVLQDEAVLVNDNFYIVGRVDTSIARGNSSTRKAIDDILKEVDKSKPIIMMDHQPVEFDKVQEAGVDIMVSGHTHRGQIAPINLITSRIFELDYGHMTKGSLNVIVSSGYGTWGPPIRVGSQSEIVKINLQGEENEGNR
ncbi:MAG: metallophosphoesterase [Clostridiales bacterium]|nr:metallophosphoesterase [Clostridiales bacterium]